MAAQQYADGLLRNAQVIESMACARRHPPALMQRLR
jgi:hypothetical protein